MSSSFEGAKKARKELEKFHAFLNSSGFVPEQCYRINHPCYPMVCCTNQVIALYLSKNFEVIPLFIRRAYQQMERLQEQPNTENYRKVVFDYFCQMAYFLENYTDVDTEWFEYNVPEQIRQGGERVALKYVQNSQ